MAAFRICPAGDQAVLCEFENQINIQTNERVMQLAKEIKEMKLSGITEVLPTYRSLLVFYDNKRMTYHKLERILNRLKQKKSTKTETKKTRIVPCAYGGMLGPDLQGMSEALGMSQQEIKDIHQSVDYKIYMLGFLPGFVYLGGLDERIHMPRLSVPRTKIPARSVGIGGNQTGVYPLESPGGWRLIGSTPLDFYNKTQDPPVLCHAGESIRFVSITEREYVLLRQDVVNGVYRAEFA